MTRARPESLPRVREDRARDHAELANLRAVRGAWTLRDLVIQAQGDAAWTELVALIDAAKAKLGSHTSRNAAILVLSTLAAYHKVGGRGYRGVIAPLEVLAATVAEVQGMIGGLSTRTVREALRILEAAGLVSRGVHGRGRPRQTKKLVSCVTLSIVAVSFWSRSPSSSRRSPSPVGGKPTPANFAAIPIFRKKEPSVPRDARPLFSKEPKAAEQLNAVSPFGDALKLACARLEGPRGVDRAKRIPPPRRYGWRPDRAEPNTLGTASRSVLYDVETYLIRARRGDRGELLGVLERELSPERWIAARGEERPSGSGIPWADLIWRWRGMDLEDRRIVCQRSILPALTGFVRRRELFEEPAAAGYCPSRRPGEPRASPGPATPGPRARPPSDAALEAAARSRERARPKCAEVELDYLTRIRSRFCGEDEKR